MVSDMQHGRDRAVAWSSLVRFHATRTTRKPNTKKQQARSKPPTPGDLGAACGDGGEQRRNQRGGESEREGPSSDDYFCFLPEHRNRHKFPSPFCNCEKRDKTKNKEYCSQG